MCGIAGYISEKKPTKKIIKAMTDRIAHRGPDGEGFYLDDNIALGHRRLAIIDLETGDQPIYNETKDIVNIDITGIINNTNHSFHFREYVLSFFVLFVINRVK